ncbi:MAG: tetratricopeptide repeat protein [Desulfobulbus sp.]|nr:tetratricopeptide repeat protein [Desulfobulbus sp.]
MPGFCRSTSPDALHETFTAACAAHADGHLAEARQHYQFLLKHAPASALVHYNIGLVYYDEANYEQALAEFSLADTLAPPDADTLFNLAVCYKKVGDHQAAIATYQRLLLLQPDDTDGHYNLGCCFRDVNDDDRAITCYRHTLTLCPTHLPAARNLAYLYHRSEQIGLAIEYYSRVLDQQPEDKAIAYLLAALQGITPESAPDEYVRDFFDAYAQDFEHNLVDDLGYDNPRQLYDCLDRSSARRDRFDHGLDLGCGTGLGGLVFQTLTATLDGVDLSARMLDQAAAKGCYSRLHLDSILHHLRSTSETYDLFLATDVFIYVGDLLPVLTAARSISRPAALFCFTTEHLENGTYRLLSTGRFAYSRSYIQDVARQTGWQVLAQESARLRRERDTWLLGDLWILRLAPPLSDQQSTLSVCT